MRHLELSVQVTCFWHQPMLLGSNSINRKGEGQFVSMYLAASCSLHEPVPCAVLVLVDD